MEYTLADQKEMTMRKMGWIPSNEKKLKKELESLKQFELDRILDASMNEIFTTERQFLRESMIL